MIKLITLAIATVFLVTCVDAQNRAGSSQNFDLEIITDSQLNEFWSAARKSGYTIESLQPYLRSKGLSYSDAQQLINRIRTLETQQRTFIDPGLREEIADAPDDIFQTLAEDPLKSLTSYEKKIYGYKVFYNRDLNFSPNYNIATPKGYMLGPEDKLRIIIYGSTQGEHELTVNPEGKIFLPFIGPISVGGNNLEAAKSIIDNQLVNIYSGLKGPNATVFTDVTVSNIRTLKINVLGEVNKPGTYALPSFSTVFNVMYAAGGPTTNGTFRDVRVYRANKQIMSIDLYRFLSSGESNQSFSLADNDVIVVGPYEKRIEIVGEVRSPGYFEVSGSETIADMIYYAGGFSSDANEKVFTLERLTGENEVVRDISPSDSTGSLRNGDRILVRQSKDPFIDKVQISGAVIQPGSYEWTESMTVADLLKSAKGLTPDALGTRFTIFRLDKNDLIPSVRSVTLDSATTYVDVALELGDVVFMPGRIETSESPRIQISGKVNKEGFFPYYEGMTLYDALVLTNGLKNSAIGGKVEVARRREGTGIEFDVKEMEIPKALTDLSDYFLKPFDHIYVRSIAGFKKERIVTVMGEVNYPGDYSIINAGMRVSDLIERVGGFTNTAYLPGVTLFRRVDVTEESEEEETTRTLGELESVLEFLNNEEFKRTISRQQYDLIERRYYQIKGQQLMEQLKNFPAVSTDSTVSASSPPEEPTAEYVQIGISIRDVMEDYDSPSNLILLNGDQLAIPKNTNTIDVIGEVFYPSTVKFEKQMSFKDYITQAGGFTLDAKANRSFIIYPNGEASRVKRFLFLRTWPEVRPGSRIEVPGGRVRQQFNVERLLGLTTSVITTYLLIETVTR